MSIKDAYRTLGIVEDASGDEIKNAYRIMALRWHPDRHHNSHNKDAATRHFLEITNAYRTLVRERRVQAPTSQPHREPPPSRRPAPMVNKTSSESTMSVDSFVHMVASGSADSLTTPASSKRESLRNSWKQGLRRSADRKGTPRPHLFSYEPPPRGAPKGPAMYTPPASFSRAPTRTPLTGPPPPSANPPKPARNARAQPGYVPAFPPPPLPPPPPAAHMSHRPPPHTTPMNTPNRPRPTDYNQRLPIPPNIQPNVMPHNPPNVLPPRDQRIPQNQANIPLPNRPNIYPQNQSHVPLPPRLNIPHNQPNFYLPSRPTVHPQNPPNLPPPPSRPGVPPRNQPNHRNQFPPYEIPLPSLGLGPAGEWVFSLSLTLEELYKGKHYRFGITRSYLSHKSKHVVIEIDIPAGCRPGTRIMCRNVGHERKPGAFQDIAFVIEEVPHDLFVRVFDDLVMDVRLPWVDGLRRQGGRIPLTGIDGRNLVVQIDPPSDKNLMGRSTVQGAGMPVRERGQIVGRGNLIVQWEILPPKPKIMHFMRRLWGGR